MTVALGVVEMRVDHIGEGARYGALRPVEVDTGTTVKLLVRSAG